MRVFIETWSQGIMIRIRITVWSVSGGHEGAHASALICECVLCCCFFLMSFMNFEFKPCKLDVFIYSVSIILLIIQDTNHYI